jgi:hypothetical protein
MWAEGLGPATIARQLGGAQQRLLDVGSACLTVRVLSVPSYWRRYTQAWTRSGLQNPQIARLSDAPRSWRRRSGLNCSRLRLAEAGDSAMPTDWTAKARDAITNLRLKTDRVLEP